MAAGGFICAITYFVSATAMPADIVLQIARAREILASLEDDLRLELAQLPQLHGFNSVTSFIAAVRSAASVTPRARGRSAPKLQRVRRGGKRATITDETKQRVKRLVQEGKTGAEIALAVGISRPSVQNIKKAFGLSRSRK